MTFFKDMRERLWGKQKDRNELEEGLVKEWLRFQSLIKGDSE